MSDTSGTPVTPYTPTSVPANANSFAQTIADIGVRLIAGATARGVLGDRSTALEGRATALEAKPDLTPRIVALEARPIVPDLTTRVTALEAKPAVPDLTARVTTLEARPILTDRVTALEARPIVPDLTTRVVALEARPVVPDLTTRVTALEARPNYTTATLTTAGVIKANITQIARTTTPISVNVASISAVGASILPSVSVTVTGVAVGDFVQAAFAAAPPTGLTISAVQATAANTVLVTFVTTGALTLSAGAQSLNFCWTR